jgi:hypothetical protein
MSLDMTIGVRRMDAVAEADVELSQGTAPAAAWLWLQNFALVAGATFAVAFSSALSVVLYLH